MASLVIEYYLEVKLLDQTKIYREKIKNVRKIWNELDEKSFTYFTSPDFVRLSNIESLDKNKLLYTYWNNFVHSENFVEWMYQADDLYISLIRK